MARLIYPEKGSLDGTVEAGLEHVPFVIGKDEAYLDEPSRYLRERATGRWNPRNPTASAYAGQRPISENSIRSYGSDLQNFFSLVEAASIPWIELDAGDLIAAYRAAMERGVWSAWGESLSRSTVKRRTAIALDFLHWSSRRGVRNWTPSRRAAITLPGRSPVSGGTIHGRRQNPRMLRPPTVKEVDAWLFELQARSGPTVALAAEFILGTGCRLEETVLVRAAQLPDPDVIQPGKPAQIVISYGTKGQRRPGDPDRKGKERKLRFDTDLLIKLHNYRQLRRPFAIEIALERGRGVPVELFLSEQHGRRLSMSSFRKAWCGCLSTPKGFTPHSGRHFFACHTLLELVRSDARLIASLKGDLPRSVLMQATQELVNLYIRPVLGHVSEDTTHEYLHWVVDNLVVAPYRLNWSAALEHADG